MLIQTRGIVLQQFKYGDSSMVIHIYTEKYGHLSFMVKGLSPKSKLSRNLFQPLTLLDIIIYYKPARNMQQIKEAWMSYPFISIPLNIQKTAIALFLSEVLFKTLSEEEANSLLFRFLYHSIQFLDQKRDTFNNFHILFLVQLTHFLGFSPENNFSEWNLYLDFREGSFVHMIPLHQDFLGKEDSAFFSELLNTPMEQVSKLSLNPAGRKYFLEKILSYYRIHLEGMGKIKSLRVLHEVFK